MQDSSNGGIEVGNLKENAPGLTQVGNISGKCG